MPDKRLSPLFDWRSAVASEDGPENSTTRHVLLTLSLHMSTKGDSCFPSTRTLSTETGLSRRTVEKHLRKAISDGWLEGNGKQRRSDGTYAKAEYEATIPGESPSPGPGESDDTDLGKQLPHRTSTTEDVKQNGSHPPGMKQVWQYYCSRYADRYSPERANRLKLDACGRPAKIRARLKEGYSPSDLKRAIDGYWFDEWHAERNKDELTYILRNQEKVEDGLTRFDEHGKPEKDDQLDEAIERIYGGSR